MTKAELLRCLKETHQQTLNLLREADPFQVIYEETGWRVKDIVAHVATWDAETLRSFHALRRGTEYRIPNFDGNDNFNAYAATARMDEPMDYIMGDWDATLKWLNIIINSMSEDELSAEMTMPSGKRGIARDLVEEICQHETDHMNDIRQKIAASSES